MSNILDKNKIDDLSKEIQKCRDIDLIYRKIYEIAGIVLNTRYVSNAEFLMMISLLEKSNHLVELYKELIK